MPESRRVAGQPNLALEQRRTQAGLSINALATKAQVDVKSVQRWLSGKAVPQRANAAAVAEALGCEPQDLWPDSFPVLDPPSPGTVPLSVYASRAEVPVQVWNQHFANAAEQIDICVYGGTFLFDAVPNFEGLLAAAITNGARVRFLVGDPSSPAIRLRGEEEGIGASLAARCLLTLTRLRAIATKVPVEVRLHDAALYVSMFRADQTLIANHHIHGLPASDNPAFVVDRETSPVLWAKYEESFNRIWDNARPTDET